MRIKIKLVYFSLVLVFIIVSFSWITSCKHNADITDIPEICFARDVLPVFKNNCAISGCHDGQGESHLTLNNYTDIQGGVIPGKPYSSRFYKAIIASGGENIMPPGQRLSLENRTIIRLWIEQGAGLTICADTSGTGNGGGINPRACFGRDILPVLVSKCASAGCHDAATQTGGYNFTTYATTKNTVVPGNPGQSKLYQIITNTSGEDKMPPAGSSQLTVAEIDSIGKWIRYGALNETCGEVCDTLNPVTFSGVIWPTIQTTCAGCHSGTNPSGNVSLASYSNVSAVASSGLLANSLKGNGVAKMPPSGSLSACRIRQFMIWISNGYLNN
jgi:mono/diheme cytochrome c family protein